MPWVFSTYWLVTLQECPKQVSDITSTKAICHIAQRCHPDVLNRSFFASDWTLGRLPIASVSWHSAEINWHKRSSLHLSGSCTSSTWRWGEDASALRSMNCIPIEAEVHSAEFRYPGSACKCCHTAGILEDWYRSSSSTPMLIKQILLCLYIHSPALLLVSFSILLLDWICSCFAADFFRSCL